MASRRVRSSGVVAAFVLIVVLVAVWFQVAGGPWPFGNAELVNAEVRGETSVTLFVAGCEGSPQVKAVEETDEQVRVSVSITQYLAHSSDCLEPVELELASPPRVFSLALVPFVHT